MSEQRAGRWVKFTGRFNFQPAAKPHSTIQYLAGMRLRVTKECADAAIARGRAVASTDPRFDKPEGAKDGSGTARDADQGSAADQ